MSIKLLHTADWQIGKGFANFEGDAGAILRAQRLKTVEHIAKIASERQVDVVLVAGDVFETNAVADETLRRTLNQMQSFKGPWVLLPGNHDAALADSVWTRLSRIGLPDNVKLASRFLTAFHRASRWTVAYEAAGIGAHDNVVAFQLSYDGKGVQLLANIQTLGPVVCTEMARWLNPDFPVSRFW